MLQKYGAIRGIMHYMWNIKSLNHFEKLFGNFLKDKHRFFPVTHHFHSSLII